MQYAELWSMRSKCKRNKVGAVLTMDNHAIGDGYNGTVKGDCNDCEDSEGNTKDSVVHAEQNAILFCARHGISTKGATLYITLSPCMSCAKMLVQSGIDRVVYKTEYRDVSPIHFLNKMGVKCDQLKDVL
jgi:dCMP deaminase